MIRCRECDHSNPDDHRFCAMCGTKLEPAVRPLDIDDDDPLQLKAPVYQFEDRSRLRQPAEVSRRDRQREQVRDTSSISSNGGRRRAQTADLDQVPREIVEPSVEGEYAENTRSTSAGIGGPSFLGLNYERGSDRGFVYDKPRQDGFVYDSDGEAPEYLLDEVPRGVSWRAWALCLLLIIGGGLGYIQWRASHHQGPDLASILARNGPTVDSSGPVLPDKSAKPADKTNPAAANANSDAASAKNATQSENKNASASVDSDSDEDSPVIDSNSSAAKPPDANTGDTKTGNTKTAKSESADSEDNADESAKAAAPDAASKNADEAENSTKPESDGPVAKTAKAARKTEVADEEPPQPKTLGEKDPLIVQADKYIQGRGVRKNCSTGINLLRQAVSEGNPAASVKLGALYWSGTCVTQSKVTAYQWFSRAHSLEPTNRWVQRSRNSLWASMSPEEQRKTSY